MSAPASVRRAVVSRDDWETPWPLFEALDREFRFTLDAAANGANRKCERYLTADEDGLRADIFDQVVWCNPPYGRGIEKWVERFAWWSMNGCTVVALLPANTDTKWFAGVWDWADEVRLLKGRVSFLGGVGNSNTGGSLVAVYRPQRVTVVPFEHGPMLTAARLGMAPRVSLWDWRGA